MLAQLQCAGLRSRLLTAEIDSIATALSGISSTPTTQSRGPTKSGAQSDRSVIGNDNRGVHIKEKEKRFSFPAILSMILRSSTSSLNSLGWSGSALLSSLVAKSMRPVGTQSRFTIPLNSLFCRLLGL